MDRQEKLLAGKAALDKCINRVSRLAGEAYSEALVCCGEDQLDTRDDLQEVAGMLRRAEGLMIEARAKAGRINTGGITRSGGT